MMVAGEHVGQFLVFHNDSDQIMDYLSDPEEIHSLFGKDVDLVIDGGPGKIKPSSVIDCTGPEPIIVRE